MARLDRAGAGIRLGQLGVPVGQLGRNRRGKAGRGLREVLRRPAERLLRLVGSAQLIEHQPLMDQGFDILRVELQRASELAQRPVGLTEQ